MVKGSGSAKFRIADYDQPGLIINLAELEIKISVNLNAFLANCSTLPYSQSIRPEIMAEGGRWLLRLNEIRNPKSEINSHWRLKQ